MCETVLQISQGVISGGCNGASAPSAAAGRKLTEPELSWAARNDLRLPGPPGLRALPSALSLSPPEYSDLAHLRFSSKALFAEP